MKLVAWISIIALTCTACGKGEGKSPFSNMAGPGGSAAPVASKGSAAPAGSAAAAGTAAAAGAGSATATGAGSATAAGAGSATAADAGTATTGSAAGSAGTTEAAGSGSAAPEPLKVGDRVQAQWTSGRWYPGKIVAITDAGTYDINYDDGDKSKGLVSSKVRRPGAAKASGGGGGGKSSSTAASSSNAPCPGPGLTRRCNGTCVNIQENNNHCGGCNNRCPSGKSCDGHMFCRDADGNL